MASMHYDKHPEDVCYDDNYINKSNHGQQYTSHGMVPNQNQSYGQSYGSGYGTTYSQQPQYPHPDTMKSLYYAETTKTRYDHSYGIAKPNHGYGTGGQIFDHQREPNYARAGQLFGQHKEHGYGTGQIFVRQKDHKMATHGYSDHQTGYGSPYGSFGIGCNEKSGMKLKGISHGYKKRNKNGYGSCSDSSGSDSD